MSTFGNFKRATDERVALLKQLPPPETGWLLIEMIFDTWLEATDRPKPVEDARRLYHGRIQARGGADDPDARAAAFITATSEVLRQLRDARC